MRAGNNKMTNSKRCYLINWVMLFFWLLPCSVSMAFWPTFHANYQRNGQTQENGPLRPGIKWKFEGLLKYTSVVVGRDSIVYAAGTNTLYAIANGKEKWRYEYSGGFISIPAIDSNGTVYVVGVKEKAYLIALYGDSGVVKWRAELGPYLLLDKHLPPIAVTSMARVYVALGDSLSAFNASGVKEWMYQFPPDLRNSTAPSLSPDEKTIYIYKKINGGLYAINHDGVLKWHDPSSYYSDFSSPAVAPDGTIYLLDRSGANLHAITPKGKKKWTVNFPDKYLGSSNVAIAKDGTIYADIANSSSAKGGAIHAINPKDGKIKWKFEIKDGYIGTTIAVDGRGNLYYAAGNGSIYCLKPDGSLIWEYAVGKEHQFHSSSPAVSQETLYVPAAGKTGILFAIGTASQ